MTGPRATEPRGIALIAVLVVLGVMLAMIGPFLLSMGHGDAASRALIDEKRADWSSASVRDLALAATARGVFATDETPQSDGLDEFPATIELPESFTSLQKGLDGRDLLQVRIEDEQRRIDLESATPLVLANLLGTVARLRAEVDLEASELPCEGSLEAFPDEGLLLVNREVIAYAAKDGDRFVDLRRGQLTELGFFPAEAFPDYKLAEESLVLDFRCVLAILYPCLRDGDPTNRVPYASVREVARIATLGFAGFDAEELDLLEQFCTVSSLRENTADWGKGERVFVIVPDETQQPRLLHVRSAAALGAGRIVRIRSRDGALVEYGLVDRVQQAGTRGAINLPDHVEIGLLRPLTLPFVDLETIVEPLVPVPVNVNTASPEVLAAVLSNLRRRPPGSVRSGDHGGAELPPALASSRAAELVDQIRILRGDTLSEAVASGDFEPRPFEGWEDFDQRVAPLLATANDSFEQRRLLLTLYDVLQLGCPESAEAGSLPIAFHSAPLVRYRASAAHLRLSGREVARLERRGEAVCIPGTPLYWGAATQEGLEEFMRIDRLSPFWQTWPVNTSAILPAQRGTIPATRTAAHLLATLFPDAGFGQPRFPDRSGVEGACRPQPSSTPFSYPQNLYALESFLSAFHPEGRDVTSEGGYEIANSGPRALGEPVDRSFDHSRISFPLTTQGGLTSRHAVEFWFRPDQLEPQILYDLAADAEGLPERNRMSVRIEDQELVFEVLDEAGLDPNWSASRGAPEDNGAARWRVPIGDVQVEPGTWYHVSCSAIGNKPGQTTLLVDGVPKGQARLRTYLSQALAVYQEDRGVNWLDDNERFVRLQVEDTEGFPEQGVLRIGQELFEYSAKDGSTFYCVYDDSMGGRRARTEMREFTIDVPRDDSGDPREDLLKITGGDLEAVVPDHQAGAGVELFGYSVPVYPQYVLQPGTARLPETLGAFAVGRAINDSGTRPIVLTFQRPGGQGGSLPIGDGFDSSWSGDIELGDPVSSPRFPPSPASDLIATAFPAAGGYALLVQRRLQIRLQADNAGTLSNDALIGGVEVIRYGARQGTRLTGVQRAVVLNIPTQDDQNGFFERGQPRQFVTKWAEWMQTQGIQVNELPNYFLFVVPISLPVSGPVDETPELVKWVQIWQQGGDDVDTEWVRYNLAEGGHVIRAEQGAWDQVRYALTQQTALDVIGVPEGGRDLSDVIAALRDPFLPPTDDGRRRIGYVDPVEVQFPAAYAARGALRFRGDPSTGTSSHAQGTNSFVLPVHRFEFDWPGYGLSAPRAGRSDRVALVQGTAREEGRTPAVEWHTVNWAVRHYSWDQVNEESTGEERDPLRERRGDWPFQLVAFQAPVRSTYLGLAASSRDQNNLQDSRFLDRMVKFPSGELPAADVDVAHVGATALGDYSSMRGLVDEVAVVARAALARPLDQNLGEDDPSFFVRPDVALTPLGAMVNAKPRQWADYGRLEQFPENGGLLMIDNEVLAFESYAPGTGEVTVAAGGRGLLGTLPRAHDEGAVVQFLEQVPAGILANGLGEDEIELELQALGGLPRDGGTVLVGTELMHYTWSRGDTTLCMPEWTDPDDPSDRTRGLFRGRFGTFAAGVGTGTPVIRFPFRYWDRHRPRALDPESAYLQVTLDHGPAFFEQFGWNEELQDSLIDLQCYVRLDGRGAWEDDPAETDGLWLFEEGEPNGKPNPIERYGERLEARFVHVFRPGAFDPVEFRAQAWKRAPTLRYYVITYQGETRILSERVTAR